jgi:hypothetical protein
MENISNNEYWEEVRDTAQNIVDEVTAEVLENHGIKSSKLDHLYRENVAAWRDEIYETIFDSRLHETIDGHQWVIYTYYNLQVLQHTNNAEYMIDNFGGESAASAIENGIDSLHCAMAYWAMYADVAEQIDTVLDERVAA